MKEIYKFTATWCNPCKNLTKQLEAKGIFIPGCDVDEPEVKPLLEKFGVRSVPTIVILEKGEVLHKFVGSSLTAEMYDALK
jgi:thioredoxin-like negative regulator of GroEL